MKTEQETYEIGNKAMVMRAGYEQRHAIGTVAKLGLTDNIVYLEFPTVPGKWAFNIDDLQKVEGETE